ncbi:MAG TPA: dicarboxylate/amino acid:cation symporter [Polyangiaceae bacterium]|nr:dicarboxylate/amino acid:cation symporter [Polyangiaceae bacterium]
MSSERGRTGISVPLYVQIIIAMAVGLVLGPLLGSSAAPLGELGRLVVQLIKGVATPLLFFAIVSAILHAEIQAKGALRMLGAASFNAVCALTIGLAISNWLKPGRHLEDLASAPRDKLGTFADKKVDLVETVAGYVPSNVVTPFSENLILSVILLAILLGFGLRKVKKEQLALGKTGHQGIESAVDVILRAFEVVLGYIVKLIPLAVFGVVCKATGAHGYAPFYGLGVYVAVGVGGLLLHVIVVYHTWLLVLGQSLVTFWRAAREPVFYAMGANSSLATLPITLKALDRLGVSRGASALGACVGTNLNNDGIILYEGMALLFVAQASGIELTLTQQLVAAAVCLVASMGVAGVPEAGFISLAVVLNTVGLPLEVLPLLLTVDWVIARARSVTNVLSDMLLSVIVDTGSVRPALEPMEPPPAPPP